MTMKIKMIPVKLADVVTTSVQNEGKSRID